MFGQLVFVRLRAAEKALREGRLDEAYRLATASDLKAHARGQAVLAALTEKFLIRARENYRADKFTDALMDLDRAEAGGVMKPEIAELRGYVRMVAAEADRRDHSRWERIHEAQKRIERGSLAAGKDMLEKAAEQDPAAAAIIDKATQRTRDAERAAEQAGQFLAAGQLAQAAERIQRAKRFDAHSPAAARLEAQMLAAVLSNAEAAVRAGNLSRAAAELRCLGSLGESAPARREVSDILAAAKQAGEAIRRHDYSAARKHALYLGRKLHDIGWLKAAETQLKQLEELHASLCTGPLADPLDAVVADHRANNVAGNGPANRPLDETVVIGTNRTPASSDADRYLLLVDGGGSYLVIRGGQASIGRAASEIPADVPIVSDLAERHANLTRVDDDYFLFSTKDVEVGGRQTQNTLLRDGDRVVLGRKAKFTFRMPSRKSSTAVLELSDTTKAPNDVRRIVLLDKHAIVANSPQAHIFCRHAGCSLVLFERNGGLWIRAKNDGHVDTEAQPLNVGQTVEIGGASLCLAAWKMPSTARSG